jgi:hypothetical protein
MEAPSSGEADPVAGIDPAAAEFPCGAPSGERNCWANTVEAVKTAPRTAVVNADVVGRKPRLLAFLGLAWNKASRGNELPAGSCLKKC